MSRIGRGRRGVENDFSAARAGVLRGKRHRGPGNLQLKKENRRTAQAFGRCLDVAGVDAIIRPGNHGNEILPAVIDIDHGNSGGICRVSDNMPYIDAEALK